MGEGAGIMLEVQREGRERFLGDGPGHVMACVGALRKKK
jgi:hypothetical protein